MQAASAQMYQGAQGGAQPGADQGSANGAQGGQQSQGGQSDNVQDADFEEVK